MQSTFCYKMVFSACAEVVPEQSAQSTNIPGILRVRGGSSKITSKLHLNYMYSPRARG